MLTLKFLEKFKNQIIFSGWQNAQSHPAGGIQQHTCASVSNGIITVGGSASRQGWTKVFTKDVYLFRGGQWSVVGRMKTVI